MDQRAQNVTTGGRGGSLPKKLVAAALRRLPAAQRERVLDRIAREPAIAGRALRHAGGAGAAAGGDQEGTPRLLAELVDLLPKDEATLKGLAEIAAKHVPFEVWEQAGWHLTPNHFYSVIPDTRALPESLWEQPSELPGIDMRDAAQVELARTAAKRWGEELRAIPLERQRANEYFVNNHAFESVDAEVYYTLIRASRPKLVVEIGSGWSTLLANRAMDANERDGHPGRILAIEPYPYDFVRETADATERIELRAEQVQQVDLAVFEQLGEGDILFIDSSHVLKIGSDVQYELLELLPRLKPGVLVHVHDIFLPGEYPRDWVLGPEHRFWNEQYLLQAFLAFNRSFEVVWASAWMHLKHPGLLERHIAAYQRGKCHPQSFWLRRVER
jgi:predicted O-methyltransferase YrrM